jgi:hypothetical protein
VLDDPGDDYSAIQASVRAEFAAAKALIETAPTTRAGLKALAGHLSIDRNRSARMQISFTVTTDGYTYTCGSDGPEGVDWLIAKYAAALAG